jgi:tRNA A-37 threonylcarbamoyl transferase component Bud32
VYPRPYANYTLLERLATGGMSEVDLARRSVDEAGYVRFLVVKRIRANHAEDAAFVRMFKDEARITSELRHTHIAQVYDFGRVGDEYYLALEYVPGTDLRAILGLLKKARQRMPVRVALRIAHDVLDALHYAHTRTDAQGRPMHIVHRDVNPRNVMISIAGEVKLIDFGVARAADRLERTQTDHFKGKVAYMAPEQIKGGDLDQRVDVFALGLTLYELLVGASPFAGLDQTQILFKILQGELPSFTVPREWGAPGRDLAAVVNRALRPDPVDRFADADAMRRAVAKVAESFGGMPSTAELRGWIGEIDPDLEARVRAKIDAWSGPILTAGGDATSAAIDGPLPLDASGTLEGRAALVPTENSGSFSRTVVVTAGAGIATVLVVGGGILAVAAVAALLALTPVGASLMPRSAPQDDVSADVVAPPDPVPDPGAVPTDPPRPKLVLPGPPASTDPSPPPTTSTAGARSPSASAGPRTAPPTTSAGDDPAPKVAIVEVVEPAATTVTTPPPQAVAVTTPPADPVVAEPPPPVEPPPPPPPPPVAVKLGVVQVASATKGLAVYVDGKKTDKVTPARLEVPVGARTIAVEGAPSQVVEVKENMTRFATFQR